MNLKMCLLPKCIKKEKELPHAPRMGKFPFKFHLCITNCLLTYYRHLQIFEHIYQQKPYKIKNILLIINNEKKKMYENVCRTERHPYTTAICGYFPHHKITTNDYCL